MLEIWIKINYSYGNEGTIFVLIQLVNYMPNPTLLIFDQINSHKQSREILFIS